MSRTCLLCAAAGLETLGEMRSTSAICQDHHAALRASGRAWCPRCRRAVPLRDWRNPYCAACNQARQRQAPPAPGGYVPVATVAARLYVSVATVVRWLRAGWPVASVKPGLTRYVEDRAAYPPPPPHARRGKRYRAELDRCRGCGVTIDNPSSKPRYCPTCRRQRLATATRRRTA